MLIKLKYKLDESSIPERVSDEDYDLIVKKYSEIDITLNTNVKNGQLLGANGHTIVYNHVVATNAFGSVTDLMTGLK